VAVFFAQILQLKRNPKLSSSQIVPVPLFAFSRAFHRHISAFARKQSCRNSDYNVPMCAPFAKLEGYGFVNRGEFKFQFTVAVGDLSPFYHLLSV
jgi:hypothetical protein